jgi:hypothetical protein
MTTIKVAAGATHNKDNKYTTKSDIPQGASLHSIPSVKIISKHCQSDVIITYVTVLFI